jgi:ribonuclease J
VSGLSIIPLGGLGEVGMNCTVYEYDGQLMIVDVGINFPEQADYGVDLIIPSFAYLLENRERVKGIVITHGHEDHIGAVPYLLRELNPPIYGPPMALALVARKLKEHGLYEHARLHEASAGDTIEIGPFEVELIHVNHSIPHAVSLAVRCKEGLVIHTGDLKVDYTPVNEQPIDLARFAALGDEGVLCLAGDSTNAEIVGHSRSESVVAEGLRNLIDSAPGRVIVTLFASNLHRVQSLLNIAHDVGRKVVLLGRSLVNNFEVGRELGLLHLPDESLLVDARESERFHHDELLILCTGSQGEPRSALTRIAMDDHRQFEVLPGDYVIYSSRVIPGNEVSVSRVINHLYRRGVRVFQAWDNPGIHASGHGKRLEQQLLINLIRPLFFLPIHGEYRMLAKHAAMAEELGVEETFILDNGDVLTLWEDAAEVTGRVSAGRVMVQGKGTDESPSVVLQDRRKLARAGIVVAWLVLDLNTGEVVSGPRLLMQGVMTLDNDEALTAEASKAALDAIKELNLESRREPAEVAEAVRRAIRRVFNKRTERKPVVVPIVHEL